MQGGEIVKIFLYLSDHLNAHTIHLITDVANRLIEVEKVETVIETYKYLMNLFYKENIVGPSYFHKDSDQKLQLESLLKKQLIPSAIKQDNIDEALLNELNLLNIVNKERLSQVSDYEIYHTESDQEFLLNHLHYGGETFKRVIQLKHIFVCCQQIINVLNQHNQLNLEYARFYFLYNQFLDNPISEFKDKIIPAFMKHLQTHQDNAMLHIELAYICNFYYKYQDAENHLKIAQSLLKVRFELTGRLGVRTKFQVDKQAQLVAQVIDEEGVQQEIQQLPTMGDMLEKYAPKQVELGEESILFEKPQLDEKDQQLKNEKAELTLQDQILLLGWINHYKKTTANDEVLQQQINAYLNLMLDKSRSWIVYSQGLLMRSINEFDHLKKMERALNQLQVLVDQYNEKEPNFEMKFENYFYTHYPDYYSLSGTFGELWMKVGMLQSGYEIFARLEMWEECIECIVGTGNIERATQEIEKLMKLNQCTIKIKCIYAEIKKDISLLKQVWKESNKRFARAQRSLGELYFFRERNYEKSIKHYKKALKINSYNYASWFMVGCAQMRINQIEDAVKSFGESVRVNEKDAESWGNMASCLIQLKRFNEAMAALEQGVRNAETDWRLWSNLMAVSLRSKKFVRFYSCVERLIGLNHHELIDKSIIEKINQTFQYQVEILNQENKRQIELNKNRLIRLYEYLIKQIGQRYYVWDGLAVMTNLFIQYDKFIGDEKLLQDRLDDIAEFRLKSCQMLTVVGWEREIQTCELLIEQMRKLNVDLQKVSKQDTQKQMKMFIEHMQNRIEGILEKKIQI